MIHILKTQEPYFSQLKLKNKTFELRKDDRCFNVGDMLVLAQYDFELQLYTNSVVVAKVTYIVRNNDLPEEMLATGYCCMSVSHLSAIQLTEDLNDLSTHEKVCQLVTDLMVTPYNFL